MDETISAADGSRTHAGCRPERRDSPHPGDGTLSAGDLSTLPRPRTPLRATALRLVVGVALLAWLLFRIDAREAWRTLVDADPFWLGTAFAIQVGSKSFGVLRWRALLAGVGHDVPRRVLLRLVLVGLFFNQLLPSSVGGDVARGMGLAARDVPRAAAAASVVGDRIVGVLALAVLALLGGVYGAWRYPDDGPWAVSIGFALLVAAILAILGRPGVLRRVSRFRRIPAGVSRRVTRLMDSLVLLAGRRDRVRMATALSLGLATCAALFHWAVGHALAIDLPLVAYFVVVPSVMLLAAVPITLNGLGIREVGWVAFLGAQGVSRSAAAAFAVLALAVPMVFALAGGILVLIGDRRKPSRDPREREP